MDDLAPILIIVGIIGAVMFAAISGVYHETSHCRELGGVPIKVYGGYNCAKEGYIDINK